MCRCLRGASRSAVNQSRTIGSHRPEAGDWRAATFRGGGTASAIAAISKAIGLGPEVPLFDDLVPHARALADAAAAGGFFSYAAGVAAEVMSRHAVDGLAVLP